MLKKIIILMFIIPLGTSARGGGGFGAAFGGATLGSFIGSSISNAVMQPRSQPVIVERTPQPIYISQPAPTPVYYPSKNSSDGGGELDTVEHRKLEMELKLKDLENQIKGKELELKRLENQ